MYTHTQTHTHVHKYTHTHIIIMIMNCTTFACHNFMNMIINAWHLIYWWCTFTNKNNVFVFYTKVLLHIKSFLELPIITICMFWYGHQVGCRTKWLLLWYNLLSYVGSPCILHMWIHGLDSRRSYIHRTYCCQLCLICQSWKQFRLIVTDTTQHHYLAITSAYADWCIQPSCFDYCTHRHSIKHTSPWWHSVGMYTWSGEPQLRARMQFHFHHSITGTGLFNYTCYKCHHKNMCMYVHIFYTCL